jgi:hypothetical protein
LNGGRDERNENSRECSAGAVRHRAGRLTEEKLENPSEAIDNAVEDMFERFPTRRSP